MKRTNEDVILTDKNFNCSNIPLDLIDANKDNKNNFTVNDIEHLAMIIKDEGFTSPIEVYQKDNGRYEISAGHRRYEAMKLLNRNTIPCFITSEPDTITKNKRLISSNIATRRLTPLEMANCIVFYKQILKDEKFKGDTRKKIAEYFNITESNVYRYECLLKLIPELQNLVNRPMFPYSSLRSAATLSSEEQHLLLNKLIELEARNTNQSEDDIDVTEIVFSRSKIENIIASFIKVREKQLKEREFASFGMNPPIEEESNSNTAPIVENKDSNNSEIIIINNEDAERVVDFNIPDDISENNRVTEQEVSILSELQIYSKRFKEIASCKFDASNKDLLKKYIGDMVQSLEKMESNL